jgi:transposase
MIQELRMIQEQGLSVQHVSQSMGIGLTAIRRWVTQYKAEQKWTTWHRQSTHC